MKIVSYNMRSLGSRVKWKAIKKLIVKEEPSFVCIQETKMVNVDEKMCRALWGDDHVEWKQSRANHLLLVISMPLEGGRKGREEEGDANKDLVSL